MNKTFRIIASVIAALIVVQAAAMAYAVAGLGIWVDGGGVLDKSAMNSDEPPFDEVVGFMIHGMNGMMLIPLLALVLMIVGFFAKFPRSSVMGAVVFGLVVIQVALGLFGHELAALGALHGLNALVLFGATIAAARAARTAPVATTADPAASPYATSGA